LFHFYECLLWGHHGSFKPWMVKNLVQGKAVLGIERTHTLKQRLKLWRVNVLFVVVSLLLSLPEQICAFANEELVVGIFSLGGTERRPCCEHHEQDDSRSEQIVIFSIVGLTQVDLRSHVVKRADFSAQFSTSIFSLHVGGKSKISDFDVEV